MKSGGRRIERREIQGYKRRGRGKRERREREGEYQKE